MDRKNKSIRKVADELGNTLASFYDKQLLDAATSTSIYERWMPKIVGYRMVRVPRYLEITIPVIEKHYCSDEYGEERYLEGLLLTFKTIRVCRIGTKVEKQPIYKSDKRKGSPINFKRYGDK